MKILLLESNVLLARELQRAVQEEGHTATLAEDLTQATRLAESQSHDLIILDLPPQIEVAVLQYWRHKRILDPVLFLSAPRDCAAIVDALAPVAYLPKPFRFADLLSQARRLAVHQSESGMPPRRQTSNLNLPGTTFASVAS